MWISPPPWIDLGKLGSWVCTCPEEIGHGELQAVGEGLLTPWGWVSSSGNSSPPGRAAGPPSSEDWSWWECGFTQRHHKCLTYLLPRNRHCQLHVHETRPHPWLKELSSQESGETGCLKAQHGECKTGEESQSLEDRCICQQMWPDHDFMRGLRRQEKMLLQDLNAAIWMSPGGSHLVLVPVIITDRSLGPKCFPRIVSLCPPNQSTIIIPIF